MWFHIRLRRPWCRRNEMWGQLQNGQCRCKHKMEARSRNHFSRRKATNISHSEHVYAALLNQHAKRMCRVTLSTVACPVLQNFSILSDKRHAFRKKIFEYKTCVLSFSTNLCETFPILRRTEWDTIINVSRLVLPDFNETLFFLDFRKILECQVSWKSVQWDPSCFMRIQTEGRTDTRKLTVTFHNSAKAPEGYYE
jgi:hypothetical protein